MIHFRRAASAGTLKVIHIIKEFTKTGFSEKLWSVAYVVRCKIPLAFIKELFLCTLCKYIY